MKAFRVIAVLLLFLLAFAPASEAREVASWRELETAIREICEGGAADREIDIVGDIEGPWAASRPGLPVITKPLTVRGNGHRIDAGAIRQAERRVFCVALGEDEEGEVLFLDLAITGGNVSKNEGGGVRVESGKARFVNCTIAGNRNRYGEGAGVAVSGGSAVFTTCTITSNAGPSGGGLHVVSPTLLQGCVVAENRSNGDIGGEISRKAGLLSSGGYNVVGTAAGDAPWRNTDRVNIPSPERVFADAERPGGTGFAAPEVFGGGPAFGRIPAGTRWLPAADARGRARGRPLADSGAFESAKVSPTRENFADVDPKSLKTWQELSRALEAHACGYLEGELALAADVAGDGTALPPIFSNLRLAGNGHVVDARASSADERPVFRIEGNCVPGSAEDPDDIRVSFEDLTIMGGHADLGGGVSAEGARVDFARCKIVANFAKTEGGGVRLGAGGTMAFTDCTLAGNGISGAGRGGGAYFEGGSLAFRNCRISDNRTGGDRGSGDGGGGVFARRSDLFFADCVLSGNRTDGMGGGAHLRDSRATFEKTWVHGNRSGGGGGLYLLDGGAELRDCLLSDNRTEYGGQGGAILFSALEEARALRLTDTVVSGNAGWDRGGGVCVDMGFSFFTRCTVAKNEARGEDAIGGGVSTGAVAFFKGTTIRDNVARGVPDDLWLGMAHGGALTGGGNSIGCLSRGAFPGDGEDDAIDRRREDER